MRGRKWSKDEIAVLRDLFPTAQWSSLLTALPGHTRESIRQRARTIGLARDINKRTPWSAAETSILCRLYPSEDAAVVKAALPGRGSLATIAKKAGSLGIKRHKPATRTNIRYVHPMIRELRAEREKREITRTWVSKKSGYHVCQILAWELGRANPDFRSMREWAEALGFELILRKKLTGDVIPWPDRKRLMAGRA